MNDRRRLILAVAGALAVPHRTLAQAPARARRGVISLTDTRKEPYPISRDFLQRADLLIE